MDTATVLAAWWGAIIATCVAIWDVVKWKKRAPRLKITVRQESDPSEFIINLSNLGEIPALIERIWLHCFVRWAVVFRKEMKLEKCFVVFGDQGLTPKTLNAGEAWQIKIGPVKRLPPLSSPPIGLCIDIYEAHRRRPYRVNPSSQRFS